MGGGGSDFLFGGAGGDSLFGGGGGDTIGGVTGTKLTLDEKRRRGEEFSKKNSIYEATLDEKGKERLRQ